MATRLFRTIVVFGTALGAGAGAAMMSSGCSLYAGDDGLGDDQWHGIIDAALPCFDRVDGACPDAWYVPIFDAPWGIIDAPMPDASPDASPIDAFPGAPT